MLTSSNGDTICPTDSTVISAPQGFTSYSWNTGASTSSIKVNAAGTYTVTVSSSCGTVTSTPFTLGIYSPVAPTVSANGNTLQASHPNAVSYQWYLGGNLIIGANSQTYSAPQSGNFSVIVVDNKGCTVASSNFAFVFNGITTLNELANMEVFPNPPADFITIKYESSSAVKLCFYAMNGEEVIREQNFKSGKTINVSELTAGIYFLKISDGVNTGFRKVVIEK